MRLKRNKSKGVDVPDTYTEEGINGSDAKGRADNDVDLSKLKKKDLLEIMLRQGEEIDNLRARVSELEQQLEDRNFKLDRVGSIAEASLAVTGIFDEAEKAVKIYLENIRSKINEKA